MLGQYGDQQMKLSECFRVPDSVLGYLEWCSGILYVNATYEEFKSIGQSSPPPPRLRYLLQTISHETYHFAQAVTTGFFFRLVCQALKCVSEILQPPLDADRIERLLASPPKMSDAYTDLVVALDKHSGDHLTDRAVIESSAMFFEYRTHFPNLTHNYYLYLLRKEMPAMTSEYRIGYELATGFLGDRAFDSILPVAFTALCFERPRDAFREALALLQRDGIPGEWSLRTIQQVAQSLSRSNRPIGSAIQVMETGAWHPIYSPVVMALNDNADRVNPIEMMIRPEQNTVDRYLPIVRPTLFRNGVLHIPSAFSDRYPKASASDVVSAIAILGGMAMRIGGRDESISRHRVIRLPA